MFVSQQGCGLSGRLHTLSERIAGDEYGRGLSTFGALRLINLHHEEFRLSLTLHGKSVAIILGLLSLRVASFFISHQALSDIIPLRDIFGLLFFTSVGMLLDPVYLLENWVKIISLCIAIAIFKGTIFSVLAKLFRYGNIVPIAIGFGLFQVGEFSFVLARLGLETKSIDQEMYSLVLAVSVLSMGADPFCFSPGSPSLQTQKAPV